MGIGNSKNPIVSQLSGKRVLRREIGRNGVAIGSLIGTELADLIWRQKIIQETSRKPVKKQSSSFMNKLSRFYLKNVFIFRISVFVLLLNLYRFTFNGYSGNRKQESW
jgi:hypothetical protein